ncbi:putative UDP-glucose 6-dehydrogenase [Helianthus annuus]|uniref:UDP-glucose 6-dehydrogenase n=1 Tax=Helianthus annuus TaxID=4232 RepID=A0A9K3HZP2_HELAN|nr:putative UDP-glucose 6-dehydrogenase [Helianthus annuus]
MIAERTNGGVDRIVECTGHIDAMIFAFEGVMIYEFTLDIPFACPFICVF